jgi:GTP-binding protein HflX
MVFNKIDLYKAEVIDEDDLTTERTNRHISLEEWENTWMRRMGGNALFISALNKDNLEAFKKQVYSTVRNIHVTRFPYNNFLYPENLDEY